ncbi:MAG: substrate-binding domain-containing protein, partial [Clostridia bacterium]
MKKLFGILLALTLVFGMVGGATAEPIKTGPLTVGLALSDMSAPVFIDARNLLQSAIDANGDKLIVCDCQADPGKLVTGIENFQEAGCDIIILQNFAGEACYDVCQKAKDNGAIICSYDYQMELAQFNTLADNEALGKVIGENCGKWIVDNYGDAAVDVGVCDYPLMDFMVVRADAMVEALHETAPNANVAIRLQAGFVPEGVTTGENFLQAAPNIKAVMGINDGGVLGVCQAYQAAGKSMEKDKIGMFGSDGSKEAATAIKEQDMFLMTVDL